MYIFFAIILVFSISSTLISGLPLASQGKIVEGEIVVWGEIPWQVSIQDNKRNQFCGGSILNNEWIITAAHCSFINAADYRVVSGTLNYEVNGTVHVIANITRHINYNGNTYENDIAVWKVDPPFVWGEQTGAVNLPQQGAITPDNVTLTVSGWGDKSYGGLVSKELLKTSFPSVNKQECNRNYLIYGGIVEEIMICGGYAQGGAAPCQGDSGGPVMYNNELRGLVSWAYGCGWEGYPAVFTEVSMFREWITQTIGV